MTRFLGYLIEFTIRFVYDKQLMIDCVWLVLNLMTEISAEDAEYFIEGQGGLVAMNKLMVKPEGETNSLLF